MHLLFGFGPLSSFLLSDLLDELIVHDAALVSRHGREPTVVHELGQCLVVRRNACDVDLPEHVLEVLHLLHLLNQTALLLIQLLFVVGFFLVRAFLALLLLWRLPALTSHLLIAHIVLTTALLRLFRLSLSLTVPLLVGVLLGLSHLLLLLLHFFLCGWGDLAVELPDDGEDLIRARPPADVCLLVAEVGHAILAGDPQPGGVANRLILEHLTSRLLRVRPGHHDHVCLASRPHPP
mmetsp:Transcript_51081/g.128196  ORF Transcript_51081/g.128196 Transcript_51081/m.128196 type:complete len:236 (+) Transcript_51081:461-1168(+)